MLRTVKNMEDYVISATDGNIGHFKDAYFDDETWCIRYLKDREDSQRIEDRED
jgi:hypothetical protein